MKFWRHLLPLCTLFVLSPLAIAQDGAKIGFVSTERVLRESVPAKAAQQKLEGEFSRREKELQDLAARIKSL